MPVEDPRIAAFARGNRRRNAIAFAIVGVLLVVGGGILLAVLLAQSSQELANEQGRRVGAGYQLIVLAGGIIIVGLATIVGAIRVGKGQLVNLDGSTATARDRE